MQYSYPATQNNGQIAQAVDTISGETIVYQYDALKRLSSASSTPNTGSGVAAWSQAFQYDGFGNLVSKTLNGGSNLVPAVNAATNQLSSASYDLNGNMTSGAGATLAYDVSNRLTSAQEVSGGIEYYGYAPDNKQVYRLLPNGNQEFTLYGARGEKLGVYAPGYNGLTGLFALLPLRTNIYFAGKMIWSDNTPAYQDRLGTNRANGARFMPFGDEITSTSNDREKFATYTRDSYTGLDYADQRFYASTYGRFNTPDPVKNTSGSVGSPSSPGSWNMYSYTKGDPVNRMDPGGTDDCNPDDWTCYTFGGSSGYCPPEFQFCSDGSSYSGAPAGCGGIPADEWNPAIGMACAAAAGAVQQQTAPPPQVTCSVSLDSQSAIRNGSPYLHTLIQVGVDVNGSVTTQDFEAGPSLGFLANKGDQINQGSFYPGPISLLFDTGFSAGECTQAGSIENLAATYPNHTYFYFLPYNSNSFTYSLLTYANVAIPSSVNNYLNTVVSFFSTATWSVGLQRAPAWGLLIPNWAP